MIKKLLFLLVLLMTAATGAWAQETQTWTSGDCTVTISDDVMTVSGAGAMADYKDSYELPWYGKYVKTIVIESGVTSIGNSAFAKCYNLESVSIPASVTSIGSQAFEDCGSDADALTVSFAEGSTPLTIGEGAFGYANLKSIDIPNRVTSIGERAFSSCSKLESVSIPASVTSIGNFAFQSCGSYAEALTVSFAEGSTLESIGESTFLEAKLTSINIPNSVTSIGTFAFSGCSNLESVSIPASVTSIGNAAFSSCSKLESVSIPASVTSISEGAFRYCGKLAKVYIYAPSLTTYGAAAFEGNAAGRKIYVLPEAVDTYKTGWPAYAADIEAMPTYAVTFADDTAEPTLWTASPNAGVTKGQQVTVTYTGTKKVIGVKVEKKAKAAPAEGHALSASVVGEIVGSDGMAYAAADKDNLPSGVTAAAKVCYVDGNGHGLALAMADVQDKKMSWDNNRGANDGKTAAEWCTGWNTSHPITGATWLLASKTQWNNMISAAGSASNLSNAFSAVGGTNLQAFSYWSSTPNIGTSAWRYYFPSSSWSWTYLNQDNTGSYIRACLEW